MSEIIHSPMFFHQPSLIANKFAKGARGWIPSYPLLQFNNPKPVHCGLGFPPHGVSPMWRPTAPTPSEAPSLQAHPQRGNRRCLAPGSDEGLHSFSRSRSDSLLRATSPMHKSSDAGQTPPHLP